MQERPVAHIRGERGEAAVADWYRSNGYEIVDRNWRCREGELDIIARRDDTVVFCEVKSRVSERFAPAAAAVDHRKQTKVRRAAMRWLAGQRWHSQLRFDVALVISGRIEVLEAAF